ncbi:serine hydrolase family protein [Candidatus Woesearchaeota archaeon]|nr:MAG: serine hydrolase family protein [Candidatus Woesearchaeota archaeon]
MKRVFIIHCWGGTPKDNWYSWLKAQLEKEGFAVEVPAMPDTEHPRRETWVPLLKKRIGKPDKDTYLVGHSIGCSAILRYLEENGPVGGCLLVAGFFEVTWPHVPTKEDKALMDGWTGPLDEGAVRKNAGDLRCLFSDNDPWVPLSNVKKFEERLGAKAVVERKQGHYSNGMATVPTALKMLLEMAR